MQGSNSQSAELAVAAGHVATRFARGAGRSRARRMSAIYAFYISVFARLIQCPGRERVARLLTTDVARHSLTSKADELLLFDQALGLTFGW